ncbi:MAG: hypothetical protein NZ473_05685, partial [Candidatus Kapabacteria bacterium]|nr:hypothetical protein [Candidatus Kapabacteria bacterium]MDW8225855.1 hypothetical protein [Bacteroidota bacterium]
AIVTVSLPAQIAGAPPTEFPDSLIVFESPRPLVSPVEQLPTFWGLVLTFSGNGFGGGVFYQQAMAGEWAWSAELTVSGARNSDEFEVYDPYTGTVYVPGKVNRLFTAPVSLSLLHFLFTESLEETFAPSVSVGFVPTWIIATPYAEEFFRAFRKARLFLRLGGHVGVGARIRYGSQSFLSIGVRYYTIPFGGAGLESIRGRPIRDFGGIVLSLRLPL